MGNSEGNSEKKSKPFLKFLQSSKSPLTSRSSNIYTIIAPLISTINFQIFLFSNPKWWK